MGRIRLALRCCLLVWAGAIACTIGCSKTADAPVSTDWKISESVVHEVSGADIADCFLDANGITILTRNAGRKVNTLLRLDHGEQAPRVLATFTGGVARLVSPTAVIFPRDKSMWLIAPPYMKEIEVTKYDSIRFQIGGFGDHCLAICGAETTPGTFALQALVVENATGRIVARERLDSGTPRAAALTSDAAIAYGQTPDRGEHDVRFSRQPDGTFIAARHPVPETAIGRSRIAMRSDGVPLVSRTFQDDFKVESVSIEDVDVRLPESLAIGRGWEMHGDILIYPGDQSLILVDTQLKQITQVPTLTVYPQETKIGLGRSEVPDQLPIWGRQQIRIMERTP